MTTNFLFQFKLSTFHSSISSICGISIDNSKKNEIKIKTKIKQYEMNFAISSGLVE